MYNINIINTGASNIKSITNAVTHLKYEYDIIYNKKDFDIPKCLILPGVGSFDKVINSLKEQDLIQTLKDLVIKDKVPILGICAGMQVLFTRSEEGNEDGLNLIKGNVKKLKYKNNSFYKVPNTGFKEVNFSVSNKLLPSEIKKEALYFNHSYGVLSEEFIYKHDFTNHNKPFVASFNYNNIFGMQFHPEKSQMLGLLLLKNFIELSVNLDT